MHSSTMKCQQHKNILNINHVTKYSLSKIASTSIWFTFLKHFLYIYSFNRYFYPKQCTNEDIIVIIMVCVYTDKNDHVVK